MYLYEIQENSEINLNLIASESQGVIQGRLPIGKNDIKKRKR